MAFGIGLGGFLQGMLEARQRAQQQANLQQEMQMRQAAQDQQANYQNSVLQSQERARKDEMERQRRDDLYKQVAHYQGIVENAHAFTPDVVNKAQAALDFITSKNPDLFPTPPQQTPAAAAGAPQAPQAPTRPTGPTPQEEQQFVASLGNQASPYQVNPSVGGSIPTPPQQKGPFIGPPINPYMFANPHPTQPGGEAPGVGTPPGATGPQVATPGTQATSDPLHGINLAINHYEQLAQNPNQSEDARNDAYAKLSQLYTGRLAMQHSMAQITGENIANTFAPGEAQAGINEKNAQAGYLRAEAGAKPASVAAQQLEATANFLTAQANMLKAQQQQQGGLDPMDQAKLAEIQANLSKIKFEMQRQQDEDAHRNKKDYLEYQQKERFHKDELGQQQQQGASGFSKERINAAIKANTTPGLGITQSGLANINRVIDEEERKTGQRPSVADVTPAGVNPDIWQGVTSPGFNLQSAIADALRRGRKDLAQQYKHAAALSQKLTPVFQSNAPTQHLTNAR